MSGGPSAGGGDLLAGFGCRGFVDIQNANRRTLRCELKGYGLADAAATTGDDGYFSVEPESSGIGIGGQSETPRFQGMKSS